MSQLDTVKSKIDEHPYEIGFAVGVVGVLATVLILNARKNRKQNSVRSDAAPALNWFTRWIEYRRALKLLKLKNK